MPELKKWFARSVAGSRVNTEVYADGVVIKINGADISQAGAMAAGLTEREKRLHAPGTDLRSVAELVGKLNGLLTRAPVAPREVYDDANLKGYLVGDNDYFAANSETAVWLMENESVLRAAVAAADIALKALVARVKPVAPVSISAAPRM